MNLSTLTHIVGQLDQIQRDMEEDLHQVENRRALKEKAKEVPGIGFPLSDFFIATFSEDEGD